jgi:hypothetical protein
MGLTKRLWEEQLEQQERDEEKKYLQGLIEYGEVPEGTESLEGLRRGSPNEGILFTECTRCCSTIPASELVEALDNGGLCNYCWHMTTKDD